MRKFATMMGAVLVCLAGANLARAAIVLTNGSFETTGALYNGALGGLFEPSGWTNLSGLNIQACSMLAGQEGTNAAGATGSRILRLVSDNPDPANTGFIVQNLGTMVAGQTYRFTADAFGGSGAVLPWGATAKFVSNASATPTTTYASQTVNWLGPNSVLKGAYNMTYTAQPADNGNPLYVWLRALPSAGGQATRGGIDNAQVVLSTPSVPATISFKGSDTTTQANWRTTTVAKPLDADGNNVYGSDGYYIYSSGQVISALPAYISGVTNVAGSVFSNAAYADFNDPRLAPGPSVANLTDTGIFYQPNQGGTTGQEWALMAFTLSQDKNFRLTILADNGSPTTTTPALFRVSGAGADSGLISAVNANLSPDYYLFDINGHAGDMFVISGTKRIDDSVGIPGIAFDSQVPEPATIALLGLGIAGLAGYNRRRRSA